MNIDYYKCDPGGNITALVLTNVKTEDIIDVSKKIMEKDNEIEQVGFIRNFRVFSDADVRLQMMGGEFCGNATRCLAWVLYHQNKGRKISKSTLLYLEVSGSHKLLQAIVHDDGQVEVEMPIKEEPSCIKEVSLESEKKLIPVNIVDLDGITHVLIEEKHLVVDTKEQSKQILKKFDLLGEEASGVINFSWVEKNSIKIHPYVWVRDTKTLIEETSCASGTIALVQAQAKQRKKTISMNVTQPSGSILIGSVEYHNNHFTKATIKGKVGIIGRYSLTI